MRNKDSRGRKTCILTIRSKYIKKLNKRVTFIKIKTIFKKQKDLIQNKKKTILVL